EHVLKDQARENLRQFALANPETAFLVRVNDATTAWFEHDLAVCADLSQVLGIVLPKAESAEQVRRVADAGKSVVPIVESAQGVLALSELAAEPGVERLSFGSLDMMLEIGTTPDTLGARILLDH